MSIAFDRAVSYYDETRALPEAIASLPIEALVRETGLRPDARVLEIGIGTGRIAIPLTANVARVTGVDLSLKMMARLEAKIAKTTIRLDLARADAIRLPFPDSIFDLAYGVHVLHLVSGWREAVSDARRVIKPGGYFVASWHRRRPDSPDTILRKELRRLAKTRAVETRRPGAQSESEILQELETWHGELSLVDVADWTEPSTPGEIIEELDRQIYSETWMISRPVMDELIPKLRDWAEAQFGSLESEVISHYNFRWLIARKP
jgi:ubiquinone/menaquinone biosynthesis C-methylase UbiE